MYHIFSTNLVNRLVEVHEDFGMFGVNGEIKALKKEYDLTCDDTRYLRKLVKLELKDRND